MLNIEDYRLIFASVGLIGVLLFASPTLGFLLHLPGGERFSELWILGPSHMIEGYPSKVKVGESYLSMLVLETTWDQRLITPSTSSLGTRQSRFQTLRLELLAPYHRYMSIGL